MSSLEKLCLNLIVQKFERFYFAFTVTTDEYVQQNFHFLQKRFSVHLATALSMQKKLKEEYLEMLLNEYLYCLVGFWFKHTRYLISMNTVFYRLPNLTRICFTKCNDEILENIVKFCPKIVEIDIRNSEVSDDGVKHLCDTKVYGRIPCSDLKNLFIRSSWVTDKGAKCLIQSLSPLEKFDYPNLPLILFSIHKDSLPKLKNPCSYNLIELNLSQFQRVPYYTQLLQTCITVCSKVESIACYISDKQQLDLFTNKNLKKLQLELKISDRKVNMDDFLQKSGCNLISLKISNSIIRFDTTCNISVSALAVNCPVLKEFHIHNVNLIVDDDDDCEQVIFSSLIKCCFSRFNLSSTKAVCLLLSSSPKLESLSIRFMQILPLDLRNIILTWCESPSAKLVEFAYIAHEKEFFSDILLKSLSLKAIFLNQCNYVPDIKNFLHSFAKNSSNKTRIFVRKYDPRSCNIEAIPYMNYINHDYIFNDGRRIHLQNYLRQEYKCDSIYDLLFTETAFFWNDPNDDWEDKWEIISI